MAMLGGSPLRRPSWMTPGFGDGIEQNKNMDFGIDPGTQSAIGQYASAPQPVQTQQGGGWSQKLGDLGTGLMAAQAAWDGDLGTSAQLSNSIGAQQRALAQKLAQSRAERDEWVWRQQYEQANPKPINNDTAADWDFYQKNLSPQQFETWKQGRYDPIVNVPLPGGQVYAGPRSGLEAALGGGGEAPATPVGRLTPLPGGGAGNGASNFPSNRVPSGNPLQRPW